MPAQYDRQNLQKKILIKYVNTCIHNLQQLLLQYALQTGRSTEDAVNSLCKLVKREATRDRNYTIIIFIDIIGVRRVEEAGYTRGLTVGDAGLLQEHDVCPRRKLRKSTNEGVPPGFGLRIS